MQDKYDALKRTNELLAKVQADTAKEIVRLVNSGAIDLAQYSSDYRLPRILLHAALRNVANTYAPLAFDQDAYATIENLTHV